MLRPLVSFRMEERNETTRNRIQNAGTVGFVTIARRATETEIIGGGFTAAASGNDVIYFKRRAHQFFGIAAVRATPLSRASDDAAQ